MGQDEQRDETEIAWETARRWRKSYLVMKGIVVHGVTEKEKVEKLDEALREWISKA